MDASDTSGQLADRRAALVDQLVALDGRGGEAIDHPRELDRVFAAADRLLEVVDQLQAGTARRLRWLAFGLLAVAALLAVLVTVGVLPALALLGVLLALVLAVGLLVSVHNAPASRS